MAAKKSFLLHIFLIIDVLIILMSAEIVILNFSPLSKNYEKQLFDNIINNKLWLTNEGIKTIPNGVIKVIWQKSSDEKIFSPIIYDTDSYKKNDFASRLSPNSFNVYKMQKDNNEYIAWIKPFSIQVCMRYIFIPILLVAFIILFINCIFILLFVPTVQENSFQSETENKEEDNPETKTYELTPEELEGLLGKEDEEV